MLAVAHACFVSEAARRYNWLREREIAVGVRQDYPELRAVFPGFSDLSVSLAMVSVLVSNGCARSHKATNFMVMGLRNIANCNYADKQDVAPAGYLTEHE